MAKSIAKAPPEVAEVCQRMKEKWHPDLIKAGVTVSLLMAHDDKGPSVKLHGRACCAIVWVNSLRDRIEGKADATIEIAGEWWETASEAERDSVLDHELYHLVVTRLGGPDDAPIYKLDKMERPLVKIRLHDWDLGGFAEIVERHGEAAVERQAFRGVAQKFEQLLLAWG